MTLTTIIHEYEGLGTLRLESWKTIDSEQDTVTQNRHSMRANFEALETGARYCADVDDDQEILRDTER
jgi:hypothetical protein